MYVCIYVCAAKVTQSLRLLRIPLIASYNLLETKRRLLYLKTQLVPRCKHFSSRL